MSKKCARKMNILLVITITLIALMITRSFFVKMKIRRKVIDYLNENYDFSFEAGAPTYYALSNYYKITVSILSPDVVEDFAVTVKNEKVSCDTYVKEYHITHFAEVVREISEKIWGSETEFYINIDSPDLVRIPLKYSVDSTQEEIFSDDNVFLHNSIGLVLQHSIESNELYAKMWDTICELYKFGYSNQKIYLFMKKESGEYECYMVDITLVENEGTIQNISEVTMISSDQLSHLSDNADFAAGEDKT